MSWDTIFTIRWLHLLIISSSRYRRRVSQKLERSKAASVGYIQDYTFQETYESFHYTSLVYLSDYEKDFEGGRFVFMDKNNLNSTIEPRKGKAHMRDRERSNSPIEVTITKYNFSRQGIDLHVGRRKFASSRESEVRHSLCPDRGFHVR